MNITEKDILAALSTVQEPDFRKDLVSLNMIQQLSLNGHKLSFQVVLTTPACHFKEKIEKDLLP
jgi:ATP-binding protein involved in chromosome partitioning